MILLGLYNGIHIPVVIRIKLFEAPFTKTPRLSSLQELSGCKILEEKPNKQERTLVFCD